MKVIHASQPGFVKKLVSFCSGHGSGRDISGVVSEVIADVASRGDAAVLDYTAKFDGASLKASHLRVSTEEMAAAWKKLPKERRAAVKAALRCVNDYHRKTLPKKWRARNPHGAMVGEVFYPIERVGLYVPGGQVPLVSSVIMTVGLAQLAKCPQIAVCTPPQKDGTIDPSLLAALHICGATEVYRVGGIQAVAAMAFGTKTIPAVDKIFGPGNAYVTEAKRQLFGRVGIDLLPGPSEVLVVADETANPAYVAADLLAQAEHGSGKEKVFLIVTDEKLLEPITRQIQAQVATLSHGREAQTIIDKACLAIVASEWDDVVLAANQIAPEHMELQVAAEVQNMLVERITTAGAILLGSETPTVLGDFTAGPSHTLPTDRTGRFFSGLQVRDFMRRTSVVRYDARSAAKAWPTVKVFSEMERLDAHGRSLGMRLGQ